MNTNRLPRHHFRLFLVFTWLLLWHAMLAAQVKVCTWNLQNFGKTKSAEEIGFMAETLRDFDVIALQEVIAGYGGAQAVSRLTAELNRKGAKWDYAISEPTHSRPYASERYAYIWKTAKVRKVKRGWLEEKFEKKIDREPFYMDFNYNGKVFTLVNFHAIPKKKQPETEIKYFKFLPTEYPNKNLIFLGDFNLPQNHTVFIPLKKMGYLPVLVDQKTSLKMKCVEGECLASEFDNIFYGTGTTRLDAGVILFYEKFPDMVTARRISDHIPVWAELDFHMEPTGKETGDR